MHFTSVNPAHLRYMILNAEAEDAIKLTVWYSKKNRLDVFVDGDYVEPTNARTTASGNVVLDTPEGMGKGSITKTRLFKYAENFTTKK